MGCKTQPTKTMLIDLSSGLNELSMDLMQMQFNLFPATSIRKFEDVAFSRDFAPGMSNIGCIASLCMQADMLRTPDISTASLLMHEHQRLKPE